MVILKSLDEQILIEIEEGQTLLLGRLPTCDVILEDGSISSQHAKLKLGNSQLRVSDMGSTNGTRLNYSILTTPEYLQDGDTVEFGNVTFTVDGPKLEIPSDIDPSSQTMTSLEPISDSQNLEDTMRYPEISDEDLIDPLPAPEESETEQEPKENMNHHLPVHLAFYIGFGLVLLGGLLLIARLWNTPPQ